MQQYTKKTWMSMGVEMGPHLEDIYALTSAGLIVVN